MIKVAVGLPILCSLVISVLSTLFLDFMLIGVTFLAIQFLTSKANHFRLLNVYSKS